jgi:hypothetical protein
MIHVMRYAIPILSLLMTWALLGAPVQAEKQQTEAVARRLWDTIRDAQRFTRTTENAVDLGLRLRELSSLGAKAIDAGLLRVRRLAQRQQPPFLRPSLREDAVRSLGRLLGSSAAGEPTLDTFEFLRVGELVVVKDVETEFKPPKLQPKAWASDLLTTVRQDGELRQAVADDRMLSRSLGSALGFAAREDRLVLRVLKEGVLSWKKEGAASRRGVVIICAYGLGIDGSEEAVEVLLRCLREGLRASPPSRRAQLPFGVFAEALRAAGASDRLASIRGELLEAGNDEIVSLYDVDVGGDVTVDALLARMKKQPDGITLHMLLGALGIGSAASVGARVRVIEHALNLMKSEESARDGRTLLCGCLWPAMGTDAADPLPSLTAAGMRFVEDVRSGVLSVERAPRDHFRPLGEEVCWGPERGEFAGEVDARARWRGWKIEITVRNTSRTPILVNVLAFRFALCDGGGVSLGSILPALRLRIRADSLVSVAPGKTWSTLLDLKGRGRTYRPSHVFLDDSMKIDGPYSGRRLVRFFLAVKR